jgi:hypothetical protein
MPKAEKHYFEKWEFRLWRSNPSVRRASPNARCVWFELLQIMMDAGPECFSVTGSIEEIATDAAVSEEQAVDALNEIKKRNIADVEIKNSNANSNAKSALLVTRDSVTVTVVSRFRKRRVEKAEKARKQAALRQKRFREKQQNQQSNAHVTQKKRAPNSNSNSKKEENNSYELSLPSKTASAVEAFDRVDAKTFGKAVVAFFNAFPDAQITPAHAGMIKTAVGDNPVDIEALKRTITKYQGNRDGHRYNPSRVGTFLSVFRDEQTRVKHETKSNGGGNRNKRNAEIIDESQEHYRQKYGDG